MIETNGISGPENISLIVLHMAVPQRRSKKKLWKCKCFSLFTQVFSSFPYFFYLLITFIWEMNTFYPNVFSSPFTCVLFEILQKKNVFFSHCILLFWCHINFIKTCLYLQIIFFLERLMCKERAKGMENAWNVRKGERNVVDSVKIWKKKKMFLQWHKEKNHSFPFQTKVLN